MNQYRILFSHLRFIGVPVLATVLVFWFWWNYYREVKWWPAVLLIIFMVNYIAYLKDYRL